MSHNNYFATHKQRSVKEPVLKVSLEPGYIYCAATVNPERGAVEGSAGVVTTREGHCTGVAVALV